VAVADDRSAALLLRVWIEEGSDQFRARVMAIGSGGGTDHTVALASSPDQVLEAVGQWLDEYLQRGTSTD
jgi:hypothetical protein